MEADAPLISHRKDIHILIGLVKSIAPICGVIGNSGRLVDSTL